MQVAVRSDAARHVDHSINIAWCINKCFIFDIGFQNDLELVREPDHGQKTLEFESRLFSARDACSSGT